MPPPSDWLSWEFWAKDSQGLYHLSLIVGGVIGIGLLAWRTFAANRSARAADAQARTAEQGHITDLFTKAVEQLGSNKLPVRLGAIYVLERISKDSRRDHWTIMETLTAYVREHAPWPPRRALTNPFVELQGSSAGEGTPAEQPENEAEPASVKVRPATDIRAILTVLGRRDEKALDLSQTNLRGADLPGSAKLQGADLRGTNLQDANLRSADLHEAYLIDANLQGAELVKANLRRANLWKANLKGARLMGADLTEACLVEAHLEGALLGGTFCSTIDATGKVVARTRVTRKQLEEAGRDSTVLVPDAIITQEQLNYALGDDETWLPQGLTRPAHWSTATSDEPAG